MGSEVLAAQFQAQLAALEALRAGRLPSDSTVLAACRGRVPATAVAELEEAAAAAAAEREQRAASLGALGLARPPATVAPAGEDGMQQQQQQHTAIKDEAVGEAQGAAAEARAGDAAAGVDAADAEGGEHSVAEQLQEAIRAKLRRLAPQQRKVQQDVMLERALQTQCSEYKLLDWRRMRRPLPGANPSAFEPPLQPAALLMQQQAARVQRAALTSRLERLQLMRLHLDRQQREQQQQQRLQQQQQQQQALPRMGNGPGAPAVTSPPLHEAPNPFSLLRAPAQVQLQPPEVHSGEQNGQQKQQQQQRQHSPPQQQEAPHQQQARSGGEAGVGNRQQQPDQQQQQQQDEQQQLQQLVRGQDTDEQASGGTAALHESSKPAGLAWQQQQQWQQRTRSSSEPPANGSSNHLASLLQEPAASAPHAGG